MKIAFIVGSFPLLSETFILNQITGLIDRGHTVHIYANNITSQDVVHVDVHKYRLIEKTFYQGNAYARMPRNILARVARASRLFLENIWSHPLVLLNSLNFLKYGRDALSLNLFYGSICFLNNKDSYDIFLCHFGHNGHVAALLKHIGVINGKVVTTFHGYDISRVVKLRGKGVYNFLFRTGDLFLPISEKWRQELIALGCEPRKIHVHRMGVDPRRFVLDRTRSDPTVRILSIGRFVEKKGLAYGLKAVARMLDHGSDIEYSIVGDGPLRPELERLIKELGITHRVRLLGWKRQDEVVQLIRGADIFLAPSVTDENGNMEGIPVVIMEAMAQGLPVVSTQHSGIPELVQNGITGYLVPERDIEALSAHMQRLVENPGLRIEFGDMGRDFILKHHNIDTLNDELVGLFRQLAGQ